jgi:hypothetical protein
MALKYRFDVSNLSVLEGGVEKAKIVQTVKIEILGNNKKNVLIIHWILFC